MSLGTTFRSLHTVFSSPSLRRGAVLSYLCHNHEGTLLRNKSMEELSDHSETSGWINHCNRIQQKSLRAGDNASGFRCLIGKESSATHQLTTKWPKRKLGSVRRADQMQSNGPTSYHNPTAQLCGTKTNGAS